MATEADELVQRAAAQLQIEMLPGAEIMTETVDVHFAHAGGPSTGSVECRHPSLDNHVHLADGR